MTKNNKKKLNKKIFLWIGIIGCLCVMVYSGYQIYDQTKEYVQGDAVYGSLREQIFSQRTVVVTEKRSEDGLLVKDGNAGDVLEGTEEVLVELPGIDLVQLREVAPEAVGWIYSEGTTIDYPVMQARDNSYYLSHLYDGTRNKVGSIFLDFRNDPDFSNQNSVLYGHHMESGQMFASLEGYKKQSYYEEHSSLILFTRDAIYKIELIGGYVAENEKETLDLVYESDEDFLSFIKEVRERSTFTANVEVNAEDKLLTMLTCTYDFLDSRYILVGKMVKY